MQLSCLVTEMRKRSGEAAVNITSSSKMCESSPKYVFSRGATMVNCLEPGDEGLYYCSDGTKHCVLLTSKLKLWEVGYHTNLMVDWFTGTSKGCASNSTIEVDN